uniref:Carbohydrate kinase PfkB domain-containing protein n=1 Tax=Chrysotila carterae TaxID=13221 RepID=A0A7S4BZR9_CHRCT|mmetsp:Transcript_18588/g.39391  ORF Transcript_18588/g.39391 Transcript_18588/m.39391 type:complete len:357 (+) Transcript_18588:207-1277(+)|eukprot:2889187-Pleurochrysis_carterae.AAC.2
MAPFPVAIKKPCRLLIVGGVYVDVINVVTAYPAEDTSCRALRTTKTRGGNAANSAVVLSQLLMASQPGSQVLWLGVVPDRVNADTMLALSQLEAAGVDTSHMEVVGEGTGQPTAYITVSQSTGSRTIVSTRNGLRELSVKHFTAKIDALLDHHSKNDATPLSWCHLECRQMPETLQMARALSERQLVGHHIYMSLEVEKPAMQPQQMLPLISICDVVFFSKEFLHTHEQEILALGNDSALPDDESSFAIACMSALSAAAHTARGLWICPWGSAGAYAFDTETGASFFESALKHEPHLVVDTVGAGDTFVAASIFALTSGATAPEMLCYACAVAGKKVTQQGFIGLNAVIPSFKFCN